MSSEFSQKPVWRSVGRCRVTSELFLDVVFTSACNCTCPYCIARTKTCAPEDPAAWQRALEDARREGEEEQQRLLDNARRRAEDRKAELRTVAELKDDELRSKAESKLDVAAKMIAERIAGA